MSSLSEIQVFIIFALEAYRRSEKMKAMSAFELFKDHKVFSFLEEGYDVLHTQSLEYVVSEIKALINNI